MTTQTISLDENLSMQIGSFRAARRYETDSQAIIELIRAGLDLVREEAEDEYLLALALEREKNDNGVRWSQEDIRRIYDITEEDLKNAGDVELEYELPG